MKKQHSFATAVLFSVPSLVTAMLMVGCPAGTQTAVEAGISATVDPAHCQEAKPDAGGDPAGPNTVALDCVNLGGTGTIRITFPRTAWWSIKLASSDAGIDAGPGK